MSDVEVESSRKLRFSWKGFRESVFKQLLIVVLTLALVAVAIIAVLKLGG